MKVTVHFDNGASMTFHGTDAEDIAVNKLGLDPDDFEPNTDVDVWPMEANNAIDS